MAIAVDDVLIPSNVKVESVGGLLSDVALSVSDGGIERRDAWRGVPIEQFVLKFGRLNVPFMYRLFRNARGRLRCFLIEDLDDNTITDVALLMPGGGSATFQCRQAYPVTRSLTDLTVVGTVYRPIYRFPDGALSVTVDGSPVTEGVDYTESDGLLTFTGTITDPVHITLTKFYKVVRALEDELTIDWQGSDIREIQSMPAIAVLFDTADVGGADEVETSASFDSTSITFDSTSHTMDET